MSGAHRKEEIQFELLCREALFVDSCLAFGLTQLCKSPSKEAEGYVLSGLLGTAQGIERLLKLVHVVSEFVELGSFPPTGEIKRLGHGIVDLLDRCRLRPQAARYNWSAADKPVALAFLKLLDAFARTKRYANFDRLAEGQLSGNPLGDWRELLAMTLGDQRICERFERGAGASELLTRALEGRIVGDFSDMHGRKISHADDQKERCLMRVATPEVVACLVAAIRPALFLLCDLADEYRTRNESEDTDHLPFFEEFFGHLMHESPSKLRRRKNWFYR